MSETYMITAKTVEEAIAIANREYADESHEVSYEIIDMPKKGFLGIGAKDAKIKVTVSKSVSADLDSIVADLKNMKVLTTKGDSGETRKERQPKQNAQKKDQPGQSAQNQPKQNSQNGQNAQNGQKKNDQPRQNEGKPAQNDKAKQSQPKENAQNGDKQPAKQNNQPKKNDKPVQQNQPKNDSKPAQKNDKPAQPKAEKPEKVEKPEKTEKSEAKTPAKAPAEVKAEKVEKVEKSEKAEKTEAPANNEKKQNTSGTSSLRNQAMPSKRQAQKKHDPAENEISASGTTVSTPVGLTDYVSDENASGFGSSDNASAGNRMSNDIRKGKKNQPANQSIPGNSGNKKAEKANSVIYGDRSSMTSRYDVAESDEDYKKLDDLEDRELTIDEIRASVKMGSTPAVIDEANEIEDIEDQEAEELNAPKPEKLRREAVSEAEMNFALEFANTLLRNMGLDASAVPSECPEGEEFDTTEECTVYPKINIIGDDTGILIGHHGETLDAIQYLINLSALRRSKQKDGDYVKIVVDIENYREKREETLRALARRMAARAVKYKRNVFLEPMNAYERRIIHSELQSVENVSTHSVGSDRDRKIIITYEGTDKAPDNRRRGRKGSGGKGSANSAENTAKDGAESASEQAGSGSAANKERRRPRKVQKMPIEKIGDILPDAEQAPEAVQANEPAEDVQE